MKNCISTNLKYIQDELNKTEKGWKRDKMRRSNRLSSLFNIPADSLSNSMLITIAGYNDIQIDNYGKIIKCTEHEIELCNEYEKVVICGDNMKILCYTPCEIAIRGIIYSISLNK